MFEYTLKFRRTTAHANADTLSRLPLPVEPAVAVTPPELVLLTEHLSNSLINLEGPSVGTNTAVSGARLASHHGQGISSVSTFLRRAELSLFEGCVLWGTRVVIPSDHREAVLTELHDTHPGMSRVKGLARM